MKKLFLTKYDHAAPVSPAGGVSMTDKQYKDECDIDVILKRYKAGQPLPTTRREGAYGDFSSVGDFMECFDKVKNAREDFENLPAEVRARFGNDVTAFYNFVLDPANVRECERLGLMTVREEVSPPKQDKAAEPTKDGEGSAK